MADQQKQTTTLQPPPGVGDHQRGKETAPITLVQYGDFECPYSGAAYGAVKRVQSQLGSQVLYIFRQFPLSEEHPNAMRAAEASEAAAAQGHFWPMHDLLFENQDTLEDAQLVEFASRAGLDLDRFQQELNDHIYVSRIKASVESGRRNGVHGTPTFLINGQFFDNDSALWEPQKLLDAINSAANKSRT